MGVWGGGGGGGAACGGVGCGVWGVGGEQRVGVWGVGCGVWGVGCGVWGGGGGEVSPASLALSPAQDSETHTPECFLQAQSVYSFRLQESTEERTSPSDGVRNGQKVHSSAGKTHYLFTQCLLTTLKNIYSVRIKR